MVMGGPACYEGPTLREAHEKGRELTPDQARTGGEHCRESVEDTV